MKCDCSYVYTALINQLIIYDKIRYISYIFEWWWWWWWLFHECAMMFGIGGEDDDGGGLL